MEPSTTVLNVALTPATPQINPAKVAKGWNRCMQTVCNVVKKFFYGAFQVCLFYVNPTIYAISFITGIIAHKHMDAALERIQKVWNSSPWGVTLIGGVGAFLALPVTFATLSWAFATHMSCRLVRKAEKAPDTLYTEIV